MDAERGGKGAKDVLHVGTHLTPGGIMEWAVLTLARRPMAPYRIGP